MPFGVWSLGRSAAAGLAASLALWATSVWAAPYLVADADSGQVLMQSDATEVWYPASLTKLMTVYVALDAVRSGNLTMDTPLVVSARAARAPPSKMGFRPGTEVTLDNALKMLMVKSPNDLAITVAEGVSGSVEFFADAMNAAGQRLGLHESHFVNPNGLHNPDHVSSARDMAMIARALLREFPEHADLFGIGELQLGNQIITNHNGLIGRYPGADGMKTGFTCPAGFNVVASANHYGRHLLVVVLGSPTAKTRNQEAADLFDRGFAMSGGSGSLDALPDAGSRIATNSNICLHRSAAALVAAEEEGAAEPEQHMVVGGRGGAIVSVAAVSTAGGEQTHTQLSDERPRFDPVPVFIGPVPGWKGPVLAARSTKPRHRPRSRPTPRPMSATRRPQSTRSPRTARRRPGRKPTRLQSSSMPCARRRLPMGRSRFETRRLRANRSRSRPAPRRRSPRAARTRKSRTSML